ncbi:MarR family winged helix-turn-helix transcriptional regulator [Yoonia litorea]|uniref:DNA-binding transcriptional regulator, MarR family n=1 Tax=Yoonia litorea TaxID=1123755 RepID=A0A1I6N2A6_9RHOB|nr:MarR family transcriptional regulator [Yoonia litorea]SFS22001.1 DNA-binding transcriptional regulator, MarR family [Yoonia litorea]
MSKPDQLLKIVGTLMRVMLVSERTPRAQQHVTRYNPHDFQTLGFLRENPGARATTLTDYLGVVPTTTSSVIARLVQRGLVAKAKHPEDGRAVSLSLTKAGQDLAETIYQQDLSNMRLFLSAIDESEQSQLIALLQRVSDRVTALENGRD